MQNVATQSITISVYQVFMNLWYKYGLSVPFLTIDNHKKTENKCKYRLFLWYACLFLPRGRQDGIGLSDIGSLINEEMAIY